MEKKINQDHPDPWEPRSIYDPDPAAEADLWFLPPAPEPAAWDMPGARPDRIDALDVQAWIKAEAAQAAHLARAASAFGALDEALRHVPDGVRRRLILLEVSEMSWQMGARLSPDRLALYLAARLQSAREDAPALLQAAWAVRRLTARTPGPTGSAEALAEFLGRKFVSDSREISLLDRPMGQEFKALAENWAAVIGAAAALHPMTRAALGWHAWRVLGLSGAEAGLDGAVTVACLGAAAGRGTAGFLPVALGGTSVWRAGGPVADRLAAWLTAVEAAALRGLMEVDRAGAWMDRAQVATVGLSGRTAPRLITALAAWPFASAPVLEAETDASRAAVQRNMTRLEDLGLVREITGQARFRLWTAAM